MNDCCFGVMKINLRFAVALLAGVIGLFVCTISTAVNARQAFHPITSLTAFWNEASITIQCPAVLRSNLL